MVLPEDIEILVSCNIPQIMDDINKEDAWIHHKEHPNPKAQSSHVSLWKKTELNQVGNSGGSGKETPTGNQYFIGNLYPCHTSYESH